MKRWLVLSALAATTAIAGSASATTRDEVITRAFSYASHPWTSTTANQTAPCSPAYHSYNSPGDYVGVPYNWGGFQSLFQFDQNIKNGYGAGAYPGDGVLDCTAGVDCSGFVSKAWGSGHYTTSDIPSVTTAIAPAAMLPADVFNKAGFHVIMLTGWLDSGEPALIESVGANVHTNVTSSWSGVSYYSPRRYGAITGTTVSTPVGTPSAPIEIDAFPYSDSRSTATSTSNTLGGCGLAPNTSEAGPEYVYQATFTEPGELTVSVTCDAGADVDVELFAPLSTNSCLARGDTKLTSTVHCGTYFIVADTYQSKAKAGAYTLRATFTPSGQPCAAAPVPNLTAKGHLGDACAYPGHPDLPDCDPRSGGASACIYGNGSSFCSRPCANDSDCSGMSEGGCCRDVTGMGELYCLDAASCKSGRSFGASGTSGTSGTSGAIAPSVKGDGEPNGASPDGGETTTGGCAQAGAEAGAWPAWIAVALGLVGARRRRRR